MKLPFRAATLLFVAAFATVTGAQSFESEPTLPAADLLPASLLRGEHHSVGDSVRIVGFLGAFQIDSDFGTFEASGTELARVRIAEVYAIAALVEMGSTEMFARALAESAKGSVQGAVRAVQNPGETAKGVGRGLKGMFNRGRDAVTSVASGDGAGSTSAGDTTASLLGVEAARRRLAEGVSADPYTTNQRLRQELQRLAEAAAAGSLTNRLTFPSVPVYNELSAAGRMAYGMTAEDLAKRNRAALEAMGCDGSCADDLQASSAYTPTLRTGLVLALERLPALADRAALVRLATTATDEVEARFYLRSAELLATAQDEGRTLRRALAAGRVLAAAGDGGLLVAAALDRLVWTQELSAWIAASSSDGTAGEIWLTGRATPAARSALEANGWSVREAVAGSADATAR